MSDEAHRIGRAFVLHEANLAQLQSLRPNVAVLPWGATKAHNFHLPHGTDVIEATAVAEAAVERANSSGALRCVALPCVPFGNDNLQLRQVATITMRRARSRPCCSTWPTVWCARGSIGWRS